MNVKRRTQHIVFGLAGLLWLALSAGAAPKDYFRITVTDADTGRGVPLVELRTVNDEAFYTDSNGVVALNEPELMGRDVYFAIKSDGYEHPADGFGYRGKALRVTAGGAARLTLKRVNIAERLYRLTGAGIYRDSVLLGLPVPITHPLMDGQVMGQDTVEVTPYQGKLYWFFGDTQRPGYPLGQFATSGATSLLPGHGGLPPEKGVDLTYWVDKTGFSRPMLPLPGFGGPVWVGGLFTLNDATGRERLLTRYVHLNSAGKIAEQGLAQWNDAKNGFEKLVTFDLAAPLVPEGHPFRVTVGGQTSLYFQPTTGAAMPLVRVRADFAHVTDPRSYEAYTPLAPGSRDAGVETKLDRDPTGHLVYAWKADTGTMRYETQQALIAAGRMTPAEAPYQLRDVLTAAPIQTHGGSVFWNPSRHRWVMIAGQAGGKASYLGELWFAESDTPVGPWKYARQIVTHEKYTFYNPTQHPFFDADDGRVIYFEGTYTDTYSGSPDKTPRYNYNQIMYRLTLDDPRLSLPCAVYRLATGGLGFDRSTPDDGGPPPIPQIAFYAIPPDRPHGGLIPLYDAGSSGTILQRDPPTPGARPLFYALPPIPSPGESVSPAVIPYPDTPGTVPLCRVWR